MANGKFLYETIYDGLLRQIREGRFPKGVRLPSEKELAVEYGVSRITSKKALELLAESGLVRRMPGRGTFLVEEAAAKLPLGGALAASSAPNGLIGLVMEDFSENFGAFLLSGVERACQDAGFHLVLKRSFGSQAHEKEVIDELLQLGVMGLIIMAVHGDTYNPIILRLAIEKFPLVLIDRDLQGVPASFVGTDNLPAAAALAGCLLDAGRRHICFVGPAPSGTSALDQRIAGFSRANALRDILVTDENLLTTIGSTIPGVRRDIPKDVAAVHAYLAAHPETDAFFAAEYNVALIVYKALEEAGRRVPQDCAIACFDGPENFIGDYMFTHIRQDEEQIGKISVELLERAMRGEAPQRRLLPGRVMAGRSAPCK